MSAEVIPFVFNHDDEETPIRLTGINGDPWFVGADVCRCLGLAHHRDSLRRLKPEQKGVIRIDSPGGPQQTTIISESGLVLLAMRSDKERAILFQDWLAEEVLPTLRRTGRYEILPANQTTTCKPDLLVAINSVAEGLAEFRADVSARLGNIEGKLGDNRAGFGRSTERYVCEGLAKYYHCECPYCYDAVIVSKKGELLENAHLHHADGNRQNFKPTNCMASCIECHKRIHNPSRADHISHFDAMSVAISFHRLLQLKTGKIHPPTKSGNPWDFRAFKQSDMGFPLALKKITGA